MTTNLEALYAAAARAGWLKLCTRKMLNGPQQSDHVGFAAADETLLEGLASASDVVISFPARSFPGLAVGEKLVIDAVLYAVREVRAVGDGSERRAKLARLATAP